MSSRGVALLGRARDSPGLNNSVDFSLCSPARVESPNMLWSTPKNTTEVHKNDSKHSFDWSIPKFLTQTSKKIMSPTYNVGIREPKFAASWKLALYPNGEGDASDGYVSLYLEELILDNPEQYTLSLQLSVLSKFNLRCNVMNSERTYGLINGSKSSEHGNKLGFREFIKKSDILGAASGVLVDDELRINCIVHFKKSPLFSAGFEFSPVSSANLSFTRKDLSKAGSDKPFEAGRSAGGEFSADICRVLWQHVVDKKYSDTVFEVGGEEFNLHRNVMARSPVFDSMFEHNMKEANEKRVTILDCEPAVFKELTRYIYTGTAENLDVLAGKLILCSDKYCMEGLKAMCEAVLIRKMSADNAAETLQLADLLNSELLKKETLQFIKSRPVDVVQSEGWQNLPPQLSGEVTLALAKMIQESLILL